MMSEPNPILAAHLRGKGDLITQILVEMGWDICKPNRLRLLDMQEDFYKRAQEHD